MRDSLQFDCCLYTIAIRLIAPARLVIAIAIFRESMNLGAIDAHDIDLTTGCIFVCHVRVSRVRDPLSIG